jgi:hypothetical protein
MSCGRAWLAVLLLTRLPCHLATCSILHFNTLARLPSLLFLPTSTLGLRPKRVWHVRRQGRMPWRVEVGLRAATAGAGRREMLTCAENGQEVVDVACASEHTMCITRDGKVYVWGRGGGGQLGLGDTEDRMEPVEVTGLVAATRMRSSLLPPTVNRAAAASGTAETKAQEPGNQQARRRGEVLVTGSGGGGSRALDGSAGSRGADALQAGTAGEKVEYKLVDGVIETLRPSAAVDDVLEKHEARWMAIAGDDASYPSAVSYLLHRINVDRDLSPILEPQGLRELAYAIYRYRNKMVEPDAQDLKYFADQTGLAGSDAERWRSSNRSKWNK